MPSIQAFDPNYVPLPPLVQYKGTEPDTGLIKFYQLDARGFVVSKYSDTLGDWQDWKTLGGIARPTDLTPALGPAEFVQIGSQMTEMGVFKPKTAYLTVGDEPKGGPGVVNLAAQLGEETTAKFKKVLQFMPRIYLRQWYEKTIWPSLPNVYLPQSEQVTGIYDYQPLKKSYDDMVWASLIDFFNSANVEYINANKIDAWAWEDEKLRSYYISQNQPALDELDKEFDEYKDSSLAKDIRAQSLIADYNTLKPIADPGLELSRQNAVRELLRQKEYDTVQAVIDAYRYAQQTILDDALSSPIPFDIVAEDGKSVQATPK